MNFFIKVYSDFFRILPKDVKVCFELDKINKNEISSFLGLNFQKGAYIVSK